MPKLAPVPFKARNDAGQKIEFVSDVRVDSDGHFRFTIPEKIWHHARELKQSDHPAHAAAVSLESGRDCRIVWGHAHMTVKKFIDQVLEDYMKVETSEEILLAYRYAPGLHYWVNPDGSIAPNGAIGEREGSWQYAGGRMESRNDDQGISFGACVIVRKTHRRGATKTEEMELWRDPSNNYEDVRARLNAFNQVDFDDNDERWRIMPYDQKAAEFFYAITESLCKIDQRLTKFFEKPTNVDKAIKSGGLPALLG